MNIQRDKSELQLKKGPQKVLYMTARPPYPPHKGDQLIAWEQIKQLKANNHQVYLITFVEHESELQQLSEQMAPFCEEVIGVVLKKHKRLLNVFKTLVNFKPLQVNMFNSIKAKKLIDEVYEKISPDIVHVQTIRVAEYFYKKDFAKCLDMIDALSLNMLRRAQSERLIMKSILYVEHSLMKRYEKKIIEDFDQTMIVSEEDKLYLGASHLLVNPNGTFITGDYIEKYKYIQKEKNVIFHGNMQYFPNVQAVLDFTENIWPSIHKANPDFYFYIVGKDPITKIRDLHGKQNIIVTGFVDDICEYLTKAMIGVYPLQSGTGMQNKILEALACGLPTIATPLALQGIPGLSNQEIICTSKKADIIESINILIEKEEERNKLALQGQRFIHENYSWNRNYEQLTDAWHRALVMRPTGNQKSSRELTRAL